LGERLKAAPETKPSQVSLHELSSLLSFRRFSSLLAVLGRLHETDPLFYFRIGSRYLFLFAFGSEGRTSDRWSFTRDLYDIELFYVPPMWGQTVHCR